MKWVTYERDGPIVTISMNRPERLNAWGEETARDIGAAFEQYAGDDEARVAILCGAGRSFCAGGDAKDRRERQAPWSKSPQDEMGVFGRGQLFKPVIGAIHGYCLGAGLLLLAMRCDIRIASEDAKFGLPEVAVGIVNCEVAISNQSLPLAVLMELTMTADPIDARRAYEIGMINKVVPAAELMAEARRMAERIARNSPVAIQLSKQILLKAHEVGAEAKQLETRLYQRSAASSEAIEGFSSIAEKTKRTA
jgi:enoyl-CoA hydratase/carnithine racemase